MKGTWNAETATIENEAPWVEVGGPIGPDGMCLDIDGNVYVTVFDQGKIAVISPLGKVVETIPLPYKRPTSCIFDTTGRYGLLVTDAEKGILFNINHRGKGLPSFKRYK